MSGIFVDTVVGSNFHRWLLIKKIVLRLHRHTFKHSLNDGFDHCIIVFERRQSDGSRRKSNYFIAKLFFCELSKICYDNRRRDCFIGWPHWMDQFIWEKLNGLMAFKFLFFFRHCVSSYNLTYFLSLTLHNEDRCRRLHCDYCPFFVFLKKGPTRR